MKRILATAIIMVAASEPVFAQSSTAVGTGIGVSKSTSRSTAVAVSGQGGAGGTGVGVVNQGGIAPSATITQNSTVPANQKVSTVPSVFAPGLAAAGLETCLGSVSVGASWLGTGLTGGGSIPDPGCAARLDARTLWSFGLKKAAVARLCLNPDIRASMPDVCGQYVPVAQPVYAPAVLPTRYASAESYAGGPIMLVEGSTGKDRLCNDYDANRQKCRLWDGETRVVHRSTPKKVAKNAAAPVVASTSAVAESKKE